MRNSVWSIITRTAIAMLVCGLVFAIISFFNDHHYCVDVSVGRCEPESIFFGVGAFVLFSLYFLLRILLKKVRRNNISTSGRSR